MVFRPKLASLASSTYVLRAGDAFGEDIAATEARVHLRSSGDVVPSLDLLDADPDCKGHDGEVFTCAYSPDGSYVLTGGWDTKLRIWDSASGAQEAEFQAGNKPISACTVSPDGRFFLSGCLEGMLARWDSQTRRRLSLFLAHGRPVSCIVYSPDSRFILTASWDSNLIIWDLQRDFEGRTLTGHRDIVAGCKLTPDSKSVLSWSYDGTLRLWSLTKADGIGKLGGHDDRVNAADVSPDGRLAVSGSRDGTVKVWDLKQARELACVPLESEVRGCLFLRDGKTIAVVDAAGRISLHSPQNLEVQEELSTELTVVCAGLAPAGNQMVLGCDNGQVRFVTLAEFDRFPLVVTATQTSRRTSTRLQRLFGRSRLVQAYVCTCPVCRQSFEIPRADDAQPLPCPKCRRNLRIADVILTA